jgi:hypothetical protein
MHHGVNPYNCRFTQISKNHLKFPIDNRNFFKFFSSSFDKNFEQKKLKFNDFQLFFSMQPYLNSGYIISKKHTFEFFPVQPYTPSTQTPFMTPYSSTPSHLGEPHAPPLPQVHPGLSQVDRQPVTPNYGAQNSDTAHRSYADRFYIFFLYSKFYIDEFFVRFDAHGTKTSTGSSREINVSAYFSNILGHFQIILEIFSWLGIS